MSSSTKRVQLYFPQDMFLKIKEEAKKRKKSMAEIVREAIDNFLQPQNANWENDSLNKIIGLCKEDISDSSYNHDKYIYGWEKKK